MAENYSSGRATSPRRRLGCLPKLIIWSLILGVIYWLLFAPIRDSSPSNGNGAELDAIDGELSPQQQAGYETLSAQSDQQPRLVVKDGVIRFLSGSVKIPDSVAARPLDKAYYFFEQYKDLLQIENPKKNLRLQNIHEDTIGNSYLNFSQEYQGIPVYGSSITVSVSAGDEINSVNGGYSPNLSMDVLPTIRSVEAGNIAISDFDSQDGKTSSRATLAIYSLGIWGDDEANTPKLVWVVTITSKTNPGSNNLTYIVDALSGNIINRISSITGIDDKFNLEIFDTKGGGLSMNNLAFSENGISSSPHNNLSQSVRDTDRLIHKIYDYYLNTFSRSSYDGNGKLIKLIVDINDDSICKQVSPAFWHGIELDGKGNPQGGIAGEDFIAICRGYEQSIDPLAHEYGHAVVSYTAKLQSNIGESGALNEAYGDLLAAFIDDQDPWKIIGNGNLFRNIASPPWPYPTNYFDKKTSCKLEGDQDFGCAHLNSVIFSHAAYLMNQKGVSVAKLQDIYFYALSFKLNSSSDLKSAASSVIDSCQILSRSSVYKNQPRISDDDCTTITSVFISVGLQEGHYINDDLFSHFMNIILNKLDEIQQDVRNAIDQTIGNLRKRVEDAINNIREYIKGKIQEGIDALIQALIDMLINVINQISIQLCGFPFLGGVIPIGAIAVRLKRRKEL